MELNEATNQITECSEPISSIEVSVFSQNPTEMCQMTEAASNEIFLQDFLALMPPMMEINEELMEQPSQATTGRSLRSKSPRGRATSKSRSRSTSKTRKRAARSKSLKKNSRSNSKARSKSRNNSRRRR